MYRVLGCVFEQHNLWLVLVAAVICVAACAGVFFVLDGAHTVARQSRRRWLVLAGILAGGGTWATHFIAMLGYTPGIPIQFNLSWTLASAATCGVGAWLAFELFEHSRAIAARIGAGVLLGGAIVAMHYLGMLGLDAAAQRHWAPDLVVASWLFSAGFSVAALHAFATLRPPYRLLASTGLLVVAIVSLHFTAMGALTLVPDARLMAPIGELDRPMLAATVATVAAGGLLVAVILTFSDRRIAAVELAAAKQAAALARHDALTGLPNRRHLLEALEKRLAALSFDDKLAVIAVDLDRFKPVNDLYGHAVGDELLVRIAKLLSEEAGEAGFVARLGGDEFVVLLPYDNIDALISHLSGMVARFDAPIRLAEHEASVGATLGVALAMTGDADSEQLLRRADIALYRGKDEGRGRFAFFESGMDRRVQERALLEHELRAAVRADEIVPHFQPLVRLETGEITGYEVLARWTHAEQGMVPAATFVRIAEQTGLIGEMTFNVLRRACREALHWPGGLPISVNIAPIQMQDPALPQKILRVLSETGFPAGRLQIEITEDALVTDFEAARTVLASLQNLGIRIALDDFGTGYSSLRHLRELPFDSLKIDQSFVKTMTESDESMTIVRTVVQLAQSLGLGVTAEGIETREQAAELRALGCDFGQGFLLGRPKASGRRAAQTPGEAQKPSIPATSPAAAPLSRRQG